MKDAQNSADAHLHWSQQKEQAAGYWHLKFLLFLFRLFPVIILRILAFPVGFFYFLFSKKGRTESRRFLAKAANCVSDPVTAKKCRSPLGPLRHIVSFSLALVEKLEAWGGKFYLKNLHYRNDDPDDDIGELKKDLENGRGVFLLASHLGNIELLRGLVSFNQTVVSRKVPLVVVFDINVNGNFSRMMKELNSQAVDIISTREIGPHTAALLEEKLEVGGIVTITGDRTTANGTDKNFLFPFLGEEAPFPSGAFYLAALMKAPVYFVFSLRRKALSLRPEYDMHVHKSTLSLECSRKERFQKSSALAASFVSLLENYCKEQPFQWYNFYDFWSKEV